MSAYSREGFICIASGGSASIKTVSFWVCQECAATVMTTPATYETAFAIHRDWHSAADAEADPTTETGA